MTSSRFKIGDLLFENAHVIVCRGLDTVTNSKLIFKILKVDSAYQQRAFEQEYALKDQFRSEKRVRSPIDLVEIDNCKALVFADIDANSLAELYLGREPTHPPALPIALQIFQGVASGLAAIHQKNIIHKDINPSNILFCEHSKEVQIIDFSISTHLDQ